MTEATTTVTMDERGRIIVPQPAREKLGIDGERATVEVAVRYDTGGDE
jgi:bifunctional DNA-binding transcriptional regulator/antitoxin component of YhaV-PrlF toxin-antitoxin module